jgi:transcriptional regulator with XRE-family HTH domain
MSNLDIDRRPIMEEDSGRYGNPDLKYGGNGLITATEIKAKLKAAGWTQKKISETLGYDASWLSKIIHGARKMNCNDLLKIYELTGITPHEILGVNASEPRPINADERISEELARLLPKEILDRLVKIVEERKK